MARMQVIWTCSVLIAMLFTESHCVQKTTLTKNWGPQSMLYLKGKYFEKMKSEQARRSTRLFTAENLLIRYTE
ncbi:hypothetical protein C0J45_5273 [Silurus meridionalis]|nr:hypothetical protein C0J45_5273 [Silurus meridionalis]